MPDLYPVDDPDDADPRLAPLLAWRQQLVDSGAVAARSFKEAHLRLVLRSGRTDVEQIREMLPGSVAQHADEMARLLAELDSGTPAQTPEQPGVPAGDVHTIAFRHDASRPGVVDLSWPDYQANGGVVLYRVVSGDDREPKSPENADLVAATPLSAASDDRPLTGPVRYYQVWVITGASRSDALSTRPVLYASGVLVPPVGDVAVREDNGLVVGQWKAPATTSSVHVYRIPVEEAEETGIDESRYRILADGEHRTGFVDSGVARGKRYRYRVRCAVDLDGNVRLSEPVDSDVEVSAVLAAVTDITVDTGFDGETFDVSWAAPGADVAIYLSQTGPSAGGVATELPEKALDQVGLTPDLRLHQPVADQPQPDGSHRTLMAGVAWPRGWSRAYVTPVTILAGHAVLGRTVSAVRTGTIRDIELVEYCNKQVLTFEWPDGAAGVVVTLAPKGHDPRAGLTGRSFEISLEDYEKYGGMHLTGALPVGGCSLHLAPVAFSGGRRVTGPVASIEYPGMLRLQYAVRIGRDPNGFPTTATVAVRSEHDLPGSPSFVLVNNPQRMPLSVHDGQPVDVAPLDAQGQLADQPSKHLRWTALTSSGSGELWAANVSGLHGWIRLFLDIPDPAKLRTIALLDPPVQTLQLTVTVL
ncbi:hypothetical protein A5731_13120 [Mycolicibacterium conceptionense]|uniref:Uncharacterized protein n=1 Tax=Mycolicibacterium conceptionense TaxID=451644 RepID=A0A1A2V7M7_9MYCO|nr:MULTISPECIES: hypothetical protein [Mycolicibacterium]MCW1824148.1 hypothetical protein [Mycolicibacterium senegalense]OBB13023.1 hypothetical protein A5718_00490 [Mycolicibacterium conceptionense]OBF03272.1 hypothetical protein A5731_13120 [Mycolicibacterium conceptionense]OBF25909.1 hypothetical protein A5726_06580 [Mycolicibacterium conceptionense]OBF43582.1 hypothetical protein A5720_13130 [Mycolicibacterium conceptionense]